MGELRRAAAPKPKPLGLRDFYNKRNRILIWHDKGGLGDVLMQRMMFEDFKTLCPDADLIFACLPEYMDAARDHPCISEVIDSRNVNINEYCVHYNTCVTIADRYENNNAPFCVEHRSDIWAKYCGVELARHDMCFRLSRQNVENCKNALRRLPRRNIPLSDNCLPLKTNDGGIDGSRTNGIVESTGETKGKDTTNKTKVPIVLFAPVSKMAVKTLLPWQIEAVIEATKDYHLVGLHNREVNELTRLGIPGVYNANIKDWMCYIAAADYVISVDTATFHMAGGLKKPLVGIFTFADGKAYGKYFDFVLVQKHRDNGNWDCGPCFKFGDCPKCNKTPKPCLTELSKEEIQAGIKNMFDRWPVGNTRISLN